MATFPLSISTSLLPSHLSYIEYWAARLFLLLAFLTIGPWLFLILYDFLLYLFRIVAFEIPYVGGRARGKARPRAPSVNVRGDGRRRRFSLIGGGGGNAGGEDHAQEHELAQGIALDVGTITTGRESRGVRRMVMEEEREMNSWEVVEESEREEGKRRKGKR